MRALRAKLRGFRSLFALDWGTWEIWRSSLWRTNFRFRDALLGLRD